MDAQLTEIYDRAKAHDELNEMLEGIQHLDTFADFLAHPSAAIWSYDYARFALRSRWPEAEPVIRRDPGTAYSYATRVLGLGVVEAYQWATGQRGLSATGALI